MSPAKRIDRKGRRRRRAWAAPFIITTALAAPGCVVKEAPPANQPTNQAQPASQPAQPQPGGQAEPGEPREAPPTVVTNPPPPGQQLPEAPTSGGAVKTHDDGTCWFYFDSPECPPDAICNPPPPKQVRCPEE
jgi:hypothetical protein